MLKRIALLAALCAPTPLAAQMHFGQAEVRIGETRSSVMSRLRAEFRLDSAPKRPTDDLWDVLPRGGTRSIGSIGFAKDTVATITKEISSDQQIYIEWHTRQI